MAPPFKKRHSFGLNLSHDRQPGSTSSKPSSDHANVLSDDPKPPNPRPSSRVSFALPPDVRESSAATSNGGSVPPPIATKSAPEKQKGFQTPKVKLDTPLTGTPWTSSDSKDNRLLTEPLVDTPFPKLYYGNLQPNRSNTPTLSQLISRGVGRGAGVWNHDSGLPLHPTTLQGIPSFIDRSNSMSTAFASSYPPSAFSAVGRTGVVRTGQRSAFSMPPVYSSKSNLGQSGTGTGTWQSFQAPPTVGGEMPRPSPSTSVTERTAKRGPLSEITNVMLDGKLVKIRRVTSDSIVGSEGNSTGLETFVTVPDDHNHVGGQGQGNNSVARGTATDKDVEPQQKSSSPVDVKSPANDIMFQQLLELDPAVFAQQRPEKDAPKQGSCICKRSKCLKLYCKCFQSSTYCDEAVCKCNNCCNIQAFDGPGGVRREAIVEIKKRRPDAFNARPTKKTGQGCACKHNRCLKKYCDCFAIGAKCTDARCACVDCNNGRTKLHPGVVHGQFDDSVAETAPSEAVGDAALALASWGSWGVQTNQHDDSNMKGWDAQLTGTDGGGPLIFQR